MNENEDQYLKERLEDQINWYSNKSSRYKKWFYSLRSLEIILASLVPILFCYFKLSKVSILFSVAVAIIASLIALFKFQEMWIEYRATSETLKNIKYLYKTKTHPYDDEDRFATLVKQVEKIISFENSIWRQNISVKSK